MLAGLLRGSATGVALSPLPLLRALLQTILAPLLVGVCVRAFVPGTCLRRFVYVVQFPGSGYQAMDEAFTPCVCMVSTLRTPHTHHAWVLCLHES